MQKQTLLTSPAKKPIEIESKFLSSKERQINWIHASLLILTPVFAIIGLFVTHITLPTLILSVLMYFWTGLGITGGYHRLWSHRAFSANYFIRLALCLGGAGAFEGSAKWWCRNHRAHHRYTDTDKDPYNAKKGFWYAHMGWMLEKQNAKTIGFADITDLQKDSMIVWQHKYYPIIAISIGILLPTFIAGLGWGDWAGGFFYASMWRMVFVHHATFFVNSLAHTFGDKSFSDHHTAFDSFITAILTLGEGYHNYHHEFPSDYRNGIRFWQYDPTKWMIKGLNFLGWTFELKYMSEEEIMKAKMQMAQRNLDEEKARLHYGKKVDHLPLMSWEDIRQMVSETEKQGGVGTCPVIIDGIVHDVKTFVHEHPGGRQTLLNYVGQDVTAIFNGGGVVHNHSKEARKFLVAMKIGILDENSKHEAQKEKGA